MRIWGLVLVATAVVGVNEAAAQAPAWCNTEGLKSKIGGGNTNMDRVLDPDWNNSLDAIIQATCWPDEEGKKRKKEVDGARASWSAKFGMTDADWKDMAEWAASASAMRLYEDSLHLDWDKNHALSPMSPVQQLIAMVRGIPGSGSSGWHFVDWSYTADAFGPKLTETGRLGYIWRCTHSDAGPVIHAICEPDIKALNRKKVSEEIRADKAMSATERMMARLMLHELDKRLTDYNAAVKKAKGKDPAYGKLFEIAATTRKEWEDTHWKNETKLLELALAMDDARQSKSRKAHEGCSDKTWAAWKETVGKMPAKTFADITTDRLARPGWPFLAATAIINTVPGYLAAVALYSCHKEQRDNESTINTLGSALMYVPGLRGPRLAALFAMRGAGLQLDDASESIEFPLTRHDSTNRFYGDDGGGELSAVSKLGKPDGKGMVEVTFAKTKEKRERCQKSRMTRRISHITDNGTVIYWSECLKWGTDVVDTTMDPKTVHQRYTTNVKAGTVVYISDGVIWAAFPKGKKQPIAVFGVPVK